ncbi:hypothetical protein F4824DRAFT_350477 [Ustulina deusta]|nr:hypothetical protein F4823DRAFT_422123 [Ustulina deusta]KAI3330203.1 hypothetical protein F4824DRAFT_350477 [Ustulina deusta]
MGCWQCRQRAPKELTLLETHPKCTSRRAVGRISDEVGRGGWQVATLLLRLRLRLRLLPFLLVLLLQHLVVKEEEEAEEEEEREEEKEEEEREAAGDREEEAQAQAAATCCSCFLPGAKLRMILTTCFLTFFHQFETNSSHAWTVLPLFLSFSALFSLLPFLLLLLPSSSLSALAFSSKIRAVRGVTEDRHTTPVVHRANKRLALYIQPLPSLPVRTYLVGSSLYQFCTARQIGLSALAAFAQARLT